MSSWRKKLTLLFVSILPIVLLAVPAEGFELMRTSGGRPLHWVGSEMPVPYYILNGPSEVRDGSDIEAMVGSFEEWERPECSYLRFQRVDEVAKTGGVACGGPRNTLEWVESGWPAELGRAVVAITMTCFEPGGGILGARIIFNGQDHEWATDGRSSAIDVRNVSTHEIGHFVGIGHSDIPGTTMWPTTSTGDTTQRELHRDDVEAVCYLYPRPQPWSPGNGTGILDGARGTAERLGVDRIGGCDSESGAGLDGAAVILLLGGMMVLRWGRQGGKRSPSVGSGGRRSFPAQSAAD